MQRTLSCCIILFLLTAISCYEEQQILVGADFDYSIENNSYTVPVQLTINNRTTGADFYTWTFEGATPASSKEKQPGTIAYDKAGTYTIRLEAWNDTQRDVKEITVVLDSAVNLAFSTAIQVNDFAPATVSPIQFAAPHMKRFAELTAFVDKLLNRITRPLPLLQ